MVVHVIDTPQEITAGDLLLNYIYSILKFLHDRCPTLVFVCPEMQRPDEVDLSSTDRWVEVEFYSEAINSRFATMWLRVCVEETVANPARVALGIDDTLLEALNTPSVQMYDCSNPADPQEIDGRLIALRRGQPKGRGRHTQGVFERVVQYTTIWPRLGVIE